MEPGYLKLYESGELDERIEKLYKILESCELCPRKCKVNRLSLIHISEPTRPY